jgi:hypothetical protein
MCASKLAAAIPWKVAVPASASTALALGDDTNTIRSARAKLTLPVPFTAGAARVFGEYEQDLFDSEKRMAAIGGDYQVDRKPGSMPGTSSSRPSAGHSS